MKEQIRSAVDVRTSRHLEQWEKQVAWENASQDCSDFDYACYREHRKRMMAKM